MTQPLLPITDAVAQRLSGIPLAIMLDVDGTLAPFAPRPEEAVVPEETRRVISALAARPDLHVALVSGRAAADARRMVSASNVWVVGNHGYEIVGPNGEEILNQEAATFRPAVAQAARRLSALVARVPGVMVEDKGWTLSVHYRLADPGVVPRLRAAVEETAVQQRLLVIEGKMILELRPPTQINKGTAVLVLALRLGALTEAASTVFVGDDRTDEDAFRALRARGARPVTVHVTHDEPRETAAELVVRDPADVRAFLEWLLEARDGALDRA